MADDRAYEDFLQKANSHATKQHQTQQSSPEKATLYLSSESDEPWTQFSQPGEKCRTALDFAKLVNVQGNARFATTEDDQQYECVVHPVMRMTPRKIAKDVNFIEIENGTRITVFAFTYDESERKYVGLQSTKIVT